MGLIPEQQFVYDSILQREDDGYSRLKFAERRGKKEGKVEGKYETALAIAKKMKEENFDNDKIAGFTARSIEEIESL